MGDSLINISADSVMDFIDKGSRAVGEGDGVMGNTDFAISASFSKNDDGNVTKVTLKLEVSIKRAHWSGGKPDPNNKKAILVAEELNKQHELKHKKLATDICAREFPKLQKSLLGQSLDDANDAVEALRAQIKKAYDDLDAREGMTDVKQNPNGSFTVKQVGV